MHPRFLKTQCQIHAEWILGAFAELIHNAYDANASKLLVDVDNAVSNPVLHFIDDGMTFTQFSITYACTGCGMTHEALNRMLCFGHEDEGETDRIGKFGKECSNPTICNGNNRGRI